MPKSKGGLGLLDPEEVLHALMAKWILRALIPGNSNLQILIRHKILQVQPTFSGRWPKSPNWIMLYKFKSTKGSKIWDRIIKGWKSLSPFIDAISPANVDEVLSTSLWVTTHFISRLTGFDYKRLPIIMSRGMCQIRDIWSPNRKQFLDWEEAQVRYETPGE